MTPTEAQDLLKNKDHFWKLVEALSQGRLQWRDVNQDDWVTMPDASLKVMALHPEEYRIKPEPREFWIILFNDCFIGDMCSSRTLADGFLKSCTSPEKRKIIHVREVPS